MRRLFMRGARGGARWPDGYGLQSERSIERLRSIAIWTIYLASSSRAGAPGSARADVVVSSTGGASSRGLPPRARYIEGRTRAPGSMARGETADSRRTE